MTTHFAFSRINNVCFGVFFYPFFRAAECCVVSNVCEEISRNSGDADGLSIESSAGHFMIRAGKRSLGHEPLLPMQIYPHFGVPFLKFAYLTFPAKASEFILPFPVKIPVGYAVN